METLNLKFPHLSEMIFDHLDNQSLSNCKVVCKTWSIYIGEQKFYEIRNIKETVKKFNKLSKPWFEVFKKANTENIMEFRKCLDQIYGKLRNNPPHCVVRINKNVTPLHVCAAAGNTLLYKAIYKLAENKQPRTEDGHEPIVYAVINGRVKMAEFIIQRSADKNPESKNSLTVLHRAAKYGHVEICESILKHLKDKNPKCKSSGITPLHMAASFGHFRVCELIIKHIDSKQRLIPHTNYHDKHVDDEKNPTNAIGWTPLHYAIQQGHVKTSQVIMEAAKHKNPIRNRTISPFHLAALENRVEICDLFMKTIKNKHPRNIIGNTPLHFAAEKGHVKVCMLILQGVKSKSPRNHDGKTPLTVARENNQFKVCWLLEKIWNCVT